MSEPARLFDDPDVGRVEPTPQVLEPGQRVVRVLPDVSGMEKEFDYLVPARWADQVAVGSVVRVDLHGRRVAGWVTAVDIAPPPGVTLRPLAKVSSVGPPADILQLARWAANRWSGRLTPIVKTASPPTMVRAFPQVRPRSPAARSDDQLPDVAAQAFALPGTTVVTVGPADDQLAFADAAARTGNSLIVVPSVGRARWMSGALRRRNHRTHLHPSAWAAGAAGGVVIGSRSAVWAPTGPLDSILVLDEHDEALQEERVPTWHARDVAIERAARAGIPCVLVSPSPSLAAAETADRVLSVSRSEQRHGWPAVEIIDRRDDEPGWTGLFSPRVAEVLRRPGPAVAVLNRKGRAQMLACGSCGELVKTEDGEFLMTEIDGRLVSPRTGETRPLICARCTGTTLKRLRLGVTRAAEELEKLVQRPVTEISSDTAASRGGAGPNRDRSDSSALLLGTEAALHQGIDADTVVFLDFDQELHAPRYRAAEQALWLLVRAARLVGGRRPESRVVVQTRSPDHRTLRAAVGADPARMLELERELRASLGFPPFGAVAEISGAGAAAFTAELSGIADDALVLGPRVDGRFLVRAEDPDRLAEIVAATPRPKERMRISVDPPRI